MQVNTDSTVETIRSSKQKFQYQLSIKLEIDLCHQKSIDQYSKLLSMAEKLKANLFNKLSANQSTLPKFNISHIESRLSDTNLTTRK